MEIKYSLTKSDIAFQVLTTNIYEDRISSPVREILSNAIDANNSVKSDKFIEIKIPNSIDTQFRVRDFGPGLSEHDMLTLYSTLFSSSKKLDSGETIGGFGIGSKSPFAYTDSFTVESYFNGEKTLYAAVLTKNKTPSLIKLEQTKTNEPNGLSVSFPIQNQDIEKFSKAIKSFVETSDFKFKQEGEISINSWRDENSEWTHGEGFHLLKKRRGLSFRLGNVVYSKINKNELGNTFDLLNYLSDYSNLVIDIPLGKATPNLARENLDKIDKQWLDEFNKNVLPNLVLDIFNNVKKEEKRHFIHHIKRFDSLNIMSNLLYLDNKEIPKNIFEVHPLISSMLTTTDIEPDALYMLDAYSDRFNYSGNKKQYINEDYLSRFCRDLRDDDYFLEITNEYITDIILVNSVDEMFSNLKNLYNKQKSNYSKKNKHFNEFYRRESPCFLIESNDFNATKSQLSKFCNIHELNGLEMKTTPCNINSKTTSNFRMELNSSDMNTIIHKFKSFDDLLNSNVEFIINNDLNKYKCSPELEFELKKHNVDNKLAIVLKEILPEDHYLVKNIQENEFLIKLKHGIEYINDDESYFRSQKTDKDNLLENYPILNRLNMKNIQITEEFKSQLLKYINKQDILINQTTSINSSELSL